MLLASCSPTMWASLPSTRTFSRQRHGTPTTSPSRWSSRGFCRDRPPCRVPLRGVLVEDRQSQRTRRQRLPLKPHRQRTRKAGFDPFNQGGTAPELRHDPDLTMQTPQSQIGTPGGGAIVLDALNDMLNRHLETGQPAAQASPLAPMPTLRPGMTPAQLAADNTGVGATRYAESQGLDRSGYWRTMQELQRMAQDAEYADLLRQQRGF